MIKISISASAEIAAAIMLLQCNRNATDWIMCHTFSMKWEKNNSVLQLCGGNGIEILSFLPICDYIYYDEFDLTKVTKNELFTFLHNDYGIILPVNTKKLGVTSKVFYHNVFMYGLHNENIEVYDFWQPSFQWDMRIFEYDRIFNEIKENLDHDQKAYLIKERKNNIEYEPGILMFGEYIKEYLNFENKTYDDNVCGILVYKNLYEYISDMSNLYYLDHTVFHILGEHFKIWQYLLTSCSEKCVLEFEELKKRLKQLENKALFMRNLAMKYWRQQHKYSQNNDWKQAILDKIEEIEREERKVLNDILETL